MKVPILGWFDEQAINYGTPLFIAGVLVILLIVEIADIRLGSIGSYIFIFAPIWLLIDTFFTFFYF